MLEIYIKKFLIVSMKLSFGGLSILFIALPTYVVFWTCKNIFEILIRYCELKVTNSDEILYYSHSLRNFLSSVRDNCYIFSFTYSYFNYHQIYENYKETKQILRNNFFPFYR